MTPASPSAVGAASGAAPEINPASQPSERDYHSARVVRPEHREDAITRLIEQQSAKIPSHLFLMVSLASMGASLYFELTGNERASRFIGMWPPALLMLGLYNKLVKTVGSE